jgi:NADPH:quinone reductase-like Zn-dependent oxidoreductase
MLPPSMNAIQCRGFGAAEVMHWTECPIPQLGAGEVLIKVVAAGVNRADLLQRQGKYPPPEGASHILGLESSGEVVAVASDVRAFKVGDRVCALLSGGGYAEFVAVPSGQCLLVPDNVSMIEAASLMETMATVWANVFDKLIITNSIEIFFFI